MKVLKFEGAGWSEAENNGVGNCRIRATFKNDQGETLYLEMIGHKNTGNLITSMRHLDFPWAISHLFNLKDKKTNHTEKLASLTREYREYTKKNILEFVNKNLKCSFDAIEVINDGTWSGFSVDGVES